MIRGRTGLGRAASSELQLVDGGVSRQHALIVQDEDGLYVLIDLASSNGTYVDGLPISDRVRLEPNTSFKIMDTEIIYEAIGAQMRKLGPDSVLTMRPADGPSLRSTVEFPPNHDPATPGRNNAPSMEVLAGPQRRALTFEGPDGTEHDGKLVEDIVEYRRLRAQYLRGGLGEDLQRRSFLQLQDRLRQPPAAPPVSQRAFCRFACWFPASVRLASGDEVDCWVRDFGVDGAQLKIEGHQLHNDTIVWLALDLVVDGQPRSEVMTSRIVWIDGDFLGLAFAGPPRSEQGRYTEGRRLREELDETRPMQPHAPPRLAINGDGG